MTEYQIFARNLIRLQEPPVINVEARPDGSLRIKEYDPRVGQATETQTGTKEGTQTSQSTHSSGGTSSQTNTGTTTSSRLRLELEASPAIVLQRYLKSTDSVAGGVDLSIGFELDPVNLVPDPHRDES